MVGLLAVCEFDAEVPQRRPAAEQPLLIEGDLAGQVAVVEVGGLVGEDPPNFSHPASSRPGRRCSLTSRRAVVMENSRSTRVSSMSNRTPWTALGPAARTAGPGAWPVAWPKVWPVVFPAPGAVSISRTSAAEGAQARQGRVLAEDDHGFEQRRGDPASRDGRADGSEGQARLDAEAFDQGPFRAAWMSRRPVGDRSSADRAASSTSARFSGSPLRASSATSIASSALNRNASIRAPRRAARCAPGSTARPRPERSSRTGGRRRSGG